MILNSIRLNNLQTANNILFQKRHKNRAKGHMVTQKPDVLIREDTPFEDFSTDCFCKNTKNCSICKKIQEEFRGNKGIEILDIDDIEFIQNYPTLSTLIDFSLIKIIDDLNKKGISTTGIHCIRYIKDNNDDGDSFKVVTSAVNNQDIVENYEFSKNGFLAFMNRVKNIKIQLAMANPEKINSSYKSLKYNINKFK